MVNISKEDFSTICICALRYCQGRRSYMPHLVQDIVSSHLEDISPMALNIIAREKDFQTSMDIWGDEIDKSDWENFYHKVEQFCNKNATQDDEEE